MTSNVIATQLHAPAATVSLKNCFHSKPHRYVGIFALKVVTVESHNCFE